MVVVTIRDGEIRLVSQRLILKPPVRCLIEKFAWAPRARGTEPGRLFVQVAGDDDFVPGIVLLY
jgi:hypothetical protein